jgi:adenylate cyclase
MRRAVKHIWHTAREYLTHWMVAGAILAATGVAPEHWLANLLHDAHLPTDALHLWAAGIDLRMVLAGLGLALIAGDIAWRRTRPASVVEPAPAAGPAPAATALALPDKPSIAVLAFTNMSGDPDQEYFSDGIAEDIITALSHIRWLFVIARNSSFTYKGRTVDIKQVGHELGVRYVLEGSVRRSTDRLRISAQLIEAATGANVWAERFDRELADIFAVQDEITEAVVSAIEPAMADAERQRVGRKAPETLGIWELYHRGLWHFFKYTPEDNRLALEFLHKAAALDPGSAAVQAALGLNHLVGGWLFAPQQRAKSDVPGLEHGRIAAGLDPQDATAHAVFGLGLLMAGQPDAAVKEGTQAVALNPSNATAQALHGAILAYAGRSEDSLPHFAQAIRLSPFDPLRWVWVHFSASALYFHGDYEACAATGRDVCRMRPDVVFGYRAVVVALAELGRLDEARQYADVIHTRFNREMRAFLSSRWPEWRETDYAAYVASLAKGGLVLRDGVLTRVA